MNSVPLSPTLCRPQQLDRERLRRVISCDEFRLVRYYEAVVVVDADGSSGIKLIAVTDNEVLVFPLGCGGGVSTSPTVTTVSFRVMVRDIVGVDRVSPGMAKLRGVMIFKTSELFEVKVKTEERMKKTDFFVATFEPNSRAFFYISRAFFVEFQKSLLLLDVANEHESDSDDDLHGLLEALLSDINDHQLDLSARNSLLHELSSAVLCGHELKRLCFQHRGPLLSAFQATNQCFGLVAFILNELDHSATRLGDRLICEYHLSLLQLLVCLFFAGHCVPERLQWFHQTPLSKWIYIATLIPNASNREEWTEDMKRMREDLLDTQIALLLEVELLQHEAAMSDLNHHQVSKPLSQALVEIDHDHTWISRLVKRVAVSFSRSPIEHDNAKEHNGSFWSLLLWRSSSLLLNLLRSSSHQGEVNRLAESMRHRRRDYIDLYLENPCFHGLLRNSTVAHLVHVADNMEEILDFLS